MRRILAVTGIRSEYDIMFSAFRSIVSNPELKLQLLVTGAHLSQRYGSTVDEIRKDGFEIAACVENLIDDDREVSRIKGAGVQLARMAEEVDRLRPDLLMVFGDREEAITTALVGSYMNIPVVHLSGGDRVVGNVDDQIRHAVTKLAHLHLTTNEESRERILKLGEQPFRVYNVGNPGLDRLAEAEMIARDELLRWHGFSKDAPILLVIQHVISTETGGAYSQMKATMEAVVSLALNTVVIHPNSDAGNFGIVKAIDEGKGLPFFRIYRNLPRREFVNTLRHAACLVGNSSAGLLEAPFLKLPVVNIGNRQKGRLHAENVQFVPHDPAAIVAAVRKACFDKEYRNRVSRCSSPYGDGKSGARIARLLAETPLDEKLRIKDITY